jgi:hypothetical protein
VQEVEMKRIIAILILIVRLDAIDLQCRFEPMRWTYVTGPACKASNLNITSRQTITSVNGETNFDGSSYKFIIVNSQVVSFIPEGLGEFFPNLESLHIVRSKLKKVEKKDLQPFPKLKELILYSNKIESLPGDLLEGNLELKQVHFNSNPITHVGHNLVTPLKKLEHASFSKTKCIDESYGPELISSLTTDLRRNCPEPTQEMNRNAELEQMVESLQRSIVKADSRNAELEAKVQKLEQIIDALTRQLLSIQHSDPPKLSTSIEV